MKKYGLVLGWGVARWLFHIGVLKYLEEKNIKISEIAWTSMGAIIGTAWVLGYSADEIKRMFKNIKYWKLLDFGFRSGVIKWKKIMKEFNKIFLWKNFKDTNIPIKIITTDLNTGKKIVIKSGDLDKAVRASMSIPGIFSPYLYGNHWLIDGGLVDNLPVSEIKNKNTIVVSVIKRSKNFKQLWYKKTPIHADVIRRSMHILLQTTENIVLENSTKNIDLIEFTDPKLEYIDFWKIDKIVEAGYKAMADKFSPGSSVN